MIIFKSLNFFNTNIGFIKKNETLICKRNIFIIFFSIWPKFYNTIIKNYFLLYFYDFTDYIWQFSFSVDYHNNYLFHYSLSSLFCQLTPFSTTKIIIFKYQTIFITSFFENYT